MFIRLIFLITGLLALSAPVLLALFVSGALEPSRPVRFSYLSTFILAGLALSIGYFCVAVFARKLASFSLKIRWLVTLLLALPLAFAFYLAIASDVLLITITCLAISSFTVWLLYVCVWLSSNLSIKRDTLKRAPYLKRQAFMSYGYLKEDGSWPKEPRFLRKLLWFIPRANPDLESLFPQVRRWALELDSSGKPIREVGLGDNNRILFKAPDLRNRGMWTDSLVLVQDIEPMNEESFNNLWENAPNSHA